MCLIGDLLTSPTESWITCPPFSLESFPRFGRSPEQKQSREIEWKWIWGKRPEREPMVSGHSPETSGGLIRGHVLSPPSDSLSSFGRFHHANRKPSGCAGQGEARRSDRWTPDLYLPWSQSIESSEESQTVTWCVSEPDSQTVNGFWETHFWH